MQARSSSDAALSFKPSPYLERGDKISKTLEPHQLFSQKQSERATPTIRVRVMTKNQLQEMGHNFDDSVQGSVRSNVSILTSE